MWLVLSLGAFLLAIGCHLVVVRLPLPISNVIRYVVGGGAVGVLLALALLVLYGISSEVVAGLALFAFLSELYIFLFTLVISSVTVSMLLRLRQGPLPEAVLTEEAQSSAMVAMRLEQLERNGFIRTEGGRYVPLSSAQRLTAAFVALRTILGHELHRQDRR
ncbi:MAG: hypothetical protein IT306_10730 [Chloroflexi bacterium]|nr:hypothetical protein [Chloroflexota bacterium]